jgi:hypothetical protein
VKAGPSGSQFHVPAHNEWLERQPNSRSTIRDFFGVGAGAQPRAHFTSTPTTRRLVGTDNGPTPVEFVLHALAACLTAGLANIAAAPGVALTGGALDRRGRHRPAGILGPVNRRSATATRASRSGSASSGDAPAEKLARSSSSPGPAPPSTT